jgi:hypothetical protein
VAEEKRAEGMNPDVVKHYFDDQILTAQKARKMYQDGVAEREGIQRESYLAYADAQATRETILRDVYSGLLDALVAHEEARR